MRLAPGDNHKEHNGHNGWRGWEPAQDWMDGEGKPQIARIRADWGSATADRTARGKDHRGHEGGHGGARRRMGGNHKGHNGHKGWRGWEPAQDRMDGEGEPQIARIRAD